MANLVIKEQELQKLMEYVFTIPHVYGREIEAYINSIAQLRDKEAAEQKPEEKPSKKGKEIVAN